MRRTPLCRQFFASRLTRQRPRPRILGAPSSPRSFGWTTPRRWHADPSSALPFLEAIEGLKSVKRAGWVIYDVPSPESVADHMYRMTWFCLAHPEISGEDQSRAVLMSIVHDAAETLTGDITPFDGVEADRKYIQEKLAFKYLSILISRSNPDLAAAIPDIWTEYAAGQTRVARLVKQIDKLECLHQAFLYQKRYPERDLSGFRSLRNKIEDPWLSKHADDVLSQWDALSLRKHPKTPIIFVIGGPGVGKGTQCTRLSAAFDLEHISVGNLLRTEQADPKSPYADFLRESMLHSVTVPAMLATSLLGDAIARAAGRRGILIDGFPRSVAQAMDFEREIATRYSTIYLESPEHVLESRVQQRAAENAKAREDDNPRTLARRLAEFRASNQAVMGHLSRNPLHTVDASCAEDEVYFQIEKHVQGMLKAGENHID